MTNRLPLQMLFVLGLLAPLYGLGCGAADDGRPTRYPVSGTVTMNGQPVAGATLNFLSSDGSRSAVGQTDAQGRYELTTFSPGDGALPGDYGVAIMKYELTTDAAARPEDEAPDEPAGDDPFAGGPDPEPVNVLPERYASVATSDLTATVVEGDNTFDFTVEP